MRTRARRLVVDGETVQWTRSRQDGQGPQATRMTERVVVWNEAGARLVLHFVDGAGGAVVAWGPGAYDGHVMWNEATYNLNRPGVVASLVRTVLADGRWSPHERGTCEVTDGFGVLEQSGAPTGTHE